MLKEFERARLALIEDLEEERIDKSLYLKKTMELYQGRLYTEPDTIASLLEGLFYYNYFNTKAKSYMMRAREEENKSLLSMANEYYEIKEKVFYKLLPLIEKEKFEAYFVEINSVKLKKRLVEVVLPLMDKVIFHSLSPRTIQYLRRRGHLGDEVRKSKIEDYINTKYY